MNKRILAWVLTVVCMLSMAAGCGKKTSGDAQVSVYTSALDMLNVVWENSKKDFPAFGGNFENNVENAPGQLDVQDVDTMTSMLLIPDDVQAHVTDAATLFHMMNTNTFTGAALKLEGMGPEDAAGKIKEAFLENPFMCGMPDEIVIYIVGSDLVYFFGASDVIGDFKTAAQKLEGGKLAVEEKYG